MSHYFKHIDSLRGVAILIVFLSHIDSTLFKSGGVNIFFVITGFLISKIFLSNNKYSIFIVYYFWIQRLARLIPNILFICFITFLLFSFFTFFENFQILLRSFLYSCLGLLNLYLLKIGNNYHIQEFDNPFLHLWAFGVIIQFIIVFPLLVYLADRLNNLFKINNFVKLLNIFFLILFFISFFGSLYFSNSLIGSFYSPLSRMWEFIIGILLYLNFPKNIKKFEILFSFLAFILFISWLSFGNFFKNEVLYSLLICSFTSLYILVGHNRSFKFLNIRFFTYLGKISFSFYLWHLPVIFFIKFHFPILKIIPIILISFFISIFLSFFTYHFIENKTRKNRVIFYLIKCSFVFTPLLVIIVTIFYFNNPIKIQKYLFKFEENFSYLNLYESTFKKFYDPYTKYSNGKYLNVKIIDCMDRLDKDYLIQNCYKKNDNSEVFFLFGTSHAAHFLPTFNNSKIIKNLFFSAIGGGIGLDDTFIYTKNDYVNNFKSDAIEVNKISNISKNTFKDISRNYKQSYIIWSERLPYYIENYVLTDNNHLKINYNNEKALEYIENKILKTFNKFNNSKIILIANIPEPKSNVRECFKKIFFDNKNKNICDYDRQKDLKRREFVYKMYKKIAKENDNFYFYDPYNQICKSEKCSFFDKNYMPIIYDGSHLTNEYAIGLTKHFDDWFRNTF